jgi:hypothetical protein
MLDFDLKIRESRYSSSKMPSCTPFYTDGRGVYVLLVIRLGKAARIVADDDTFPLTFGFTTGANLTYKPAWHRTWQLRSASRSMR